MARRQNHNGVHRKQGISCAHGSIGFVSVRIESWKEGGRRGEAEEERDAEENEEQEGEMVQEGVACG